MLGSLEATFGPPVDYVAIPRLVQNVLRTFRKYITQCPNWSHSAEETRKAAKLKARIQTTWDIVDVERQLRVSPISALCVSGSPIPSKGHYKLVTQAAQTSRLEPTYTAGETTPTELLGVVGVDQFGQRHLAPLMNLSPQQVQQWLGGTPAVIRPLVITVPHFPKVIRKANRTSPFRDLLEYMHFGLLKDR